MVAILMVRALFVLSTEKIVAQVDDQQLVQDFIFTVWTNYGTEMGQTSFLHEVTEMFLKEFGDESTMKDNDEYQSNASTALLRLRSTSWHTR